MLNKNDPSIFLTLSDERITSKTLICTLKSNPIPLRAELNILVKKGKISNDKFWAKQLMSQQPSLSAYDIIYFT